MSITENVQNTLKELAAGNCFHEPVNLVAATKTRTAAEINDPLHAGITDIGENRVQEFRDKYDAVQGANRHFIGHLQLNKIKYLVGKTYLYQSCDRMELAEELAKRSQKAGVVSDVLVEVNIGCEESKSGFAYENAFAAYEKIREIQGLRVRGFMAMLPLAGEREFLLDLVRKMRTLYEKAKATDPNIAFLSMGMSGDYKLCLEGGSNMVRLGTSLFGARNYNI